MIKDTLIAVGAVSKEFSGSRLVNTSAHAHTQAVTAQVIAAAEGDYEVHFECGVIDENGSVKYGEIANFKQNQGKTPTFVPISLACMFRFRKVSGAMNIEVRAVS